MNDTYIEYSTFNAQLAPFYSKVAWKQRTANHSSRPSLHSFLMRKDICKKTQRTTDPDESGNCGFLLHPYKLYSQITRLDWTSIKARTLRSSLYDPRLSLC